MFEVCVTQPGGDGNPDKSACSLEMNVDCT
jgi:hypothetical protein